MTLNKQDKDNLKTALFYLADGFKDKPEISENNKEGETRITGFEYVIPDEAVKDYLDGKRELEDEEILRAFAGLVYSKIKDYPELLKEVKKDYFNF